MIKLDLIQKVWSSTNSMESKKYYYYYVNCMYFILLFKNNHNLSLREEISFVPLVMLVVQIMTSFLYSYPSNLNAAISP